MTSAAQWDALLESGDTVLRFAAASLPLDDPRFLALRGLTVTHRTDPATRSPRAFGVYSLAVSALWAATQPRST
jgi:hypothetical protein